MINRRTSSNRLGRSFGAILTMALTLYLSTAIAQPRPDIIERPDIKDRYIVSFLPGSGAADRAEAVRQAGGNAYPLISD